MLASDLKKGTIFKEAGQPFMVEKYEHIKSARGGANVKVKTRNLISGSVLEKSYLASAKIEDADVFKKNAQYLYKDHNFVFMDPDTYEQVQISSDVVGDSEKYLIEGESVIVMYYESKPVSIDLPNSLVFEVTYTEPGFKGNTVSNVQKDAVLNNGATIKVPTFVKIGDKIKVDTRSGEYLSKA